MKAKMHIICHSMGNYVFHHAVKAMATERDIEKWPLPCRARDTSVDEFCKRLQRAADWLFSWLPWSRTPGNASVPGETEAGCVVLCQEEHGGKLFDATKTIIHAAADVTRADMDATVEWLTKAVDKIKEEQQRQRSAGAAGGAGSAPLPQVPYAGADMKLPNITLYCSRRDLALLSSSWIRRLSLARDKGGQAGFFQRKGLGPIELCGHVFHPYLHENVTTVDATGARRRAGRAAGSSHDSFDRPCCPSLPPCLAGSQHPPAPRSSNPPSLTIRARPCHRCGEGFALDNFGHGYYAEHRQVLTDVSEALAGATQVYDQLDDAVLLAGDVQGDAQGCGPRLCVRTAITFSRDGELWKCVKCNAKVRADGRHLW